MHRLEADHQEAIAPLGICTAIDLRSSEEVGRGTFTGSAAPVRHLPVFEVGPTFSEPIEDVARTLADAYVWMLSEGSGSIRTAIELLGEPRDLPAVVYCAAGKDRTGVVVAIVLLLLGAEREVVAADYALRRRARGSAARLAPRQRRLAGPVGRRRDLPRADRGDGPLPRLARRGVRLARRLPREHRGRRRRRACVSRRRPARRAVGGKPGLPAESPPGAPGALPDVRGASSHRCGDDPEAADSGSSSSGTGALHTGAGCRRTAVGGTPSRLGEILAGGLRLGVKGLRKLVIGLRDGRPRRPWEE